MLIVLQRVTSASIAVDNRCIANIEQGLLALCGFEQHDNDTSCPPLIDKMLNYRLFSDDSDKMNLSVRDIKGDVLFVPQFTLAANTQKGLRPSFSSSLAPALSQPLFDTVSQYCKAQYNNTQFGQFGADMKITLCNDGPVTFLLRN